MKLSLNTLQQFVDVKSIPFEQFVSTFSSAIAEIEDIQKLSEKYKGIFVGEVREIKPHPKSEKLFVCKINLGNTNVQVCAGANNIKVGDKIAYISPGFLTPVNPYPDRKHETIAKRPLGGVESNGMLLSEKELGFGDDHSRILVLPVDLTPGDKLTKALALDDTIITVENKALTHRPDCFGIYGIAREISAAFNLDLNTPDWLSPKVSNIDEDENPFNVAIKNPKDHMFTKRYSAISLGNVNVQESPLWLKIFLQKHDIQSVNNVVDITNYVMLLTSQPLHAFDYDKVNGTVTARVAQRSEKLLTLDNKVYELDSETVVIADDGGALGIGGVIGGKESGISDSTTKVIIESANFDLYNIRKTSMKLGLFTDAVTRFGKGQDPEQTITALLMVSKLLVELASAKITSNIKDAYPYPRKKQHIEVTTDYLRTRIGVSEKELPTNQIVTYLSRLELNPILKANTISLTIPTFRYDLCNAEDILEEVARLYGYNKIVPTVPTHTGKPTHQVHAITREQNLRHTLTASGGNEIMTFSFIGDELYTKCTLSTKDCYHIQNPLSPELSYMRCTILPNLLEKVAENTAQTSEPFMLYEHGVTHIKADLGPDKLPTEYHKLSFVYTNPVSTSKTSAYYHSKLYLELVFKTLGIKKGTIRYTLLTKYINPMPAWLRLITPMFHKGQSAIVELIDEHANKKRIPIGIVGAFHPTVIENMRVPAYTSGVEVLLDSIPKALTGISNYREPSNFPSVIQDICFIVDKDVTYEGIINAVLTSRGAEFMEKIEPVDIYQENKSDETKQVTIRIYFNKADSQITNEEVDIARKQLERNVRDKTEGRVKA
ncbi:phenylalanine--tRNA ligase subunit beta [Candidatus Dojkabacteria bacterium]|nr:phenylalanine--tRNA ligase subunit beta [Candidatus Dojkabacteria bacterium]